MDAERRDHLAGIFAREGLGPLEFLRPPGGRTDDGIPTGSGTRLHGFCEIEEVNMGIRVHTRII